jgi:hypothetical protein
MLLFFTSHVIFSLMLPEWSVPDVTILSMLWSYIMYKLISENLKK